MLMDPTLTSIGKVLEPVNMHYVVGIATTSWYIDDELRPFHLTLSTSKWTSYLHAMATLNALMVCNAGKVPDDVEPAATQSAHMATMQSHA